MYSWAQKCVQVCVYTPVYILWIWLQIRKKIKFKLNKLIIFELFKWVEKFIKQKFTWHQRTREQTENIGKNIFI